MSSDLVADIGALNERFADADAGWKRLVARLADEGWARLVARVETLAAENGALRRELEIERLAARLATLAPRWVERTEREGRAGALDRAEAGSERKTT